MKPFPEFSSSLWAMVMPYLIALAILFLDSQTRTGGSTNPGIFFIVIMIPVVWFSTAKGFKGLTKAFGLSAPTLVNIILILAGIGLGTVIFYAVSQPMSILLSDYPAIAQSFMPLYNPFSVYGPFTQLSVSLESVLFIIVFFSFVMFGETILLVSGYKILANFLYERTNWDDDTIGLTSRFINLILWSFIHIMAVGTSALLPFMLMAVLIGFMFFMIYYIFAEDIVHPEPGWNFLTYLAFGEIFMHGTYDIWIGLNSYNLVLPMLTGIALGLIFLILAGTLSIMIRNGWIRV